MHLANLPSLLTLTWTIILVVHLPQALCEQQSMMTWDSSDANVCGPNATEPLCLPHDDILDIWRVNIDCSSVPDTLSVIVTNIDDAGTVEVVEFSELRLSCTDGLAQTEMTPVECSSGYGDGSLTYTLTYANLSAAGIEPGWTCSVSACFTIRKRSLKYVYAPTENCTLPLAPTTEVDITSTSTVTVHETTAPEVDSTSTITVTVYDIAAGDDNMQSTFTVVPAVLVPIIVMLLLVVTIVLLILMIHFWTRQQKVRRAALLVFDQQNMIFDPEYAPAVCIDKPSSAYTHRTSVISNTEFLQYFTSSLDNKSLLAHGSNVQLVMFNSNNYTDTGIIVGQDLPHTSNSKQNNTSGVGSTTKDVAGAPKEALVDGYYPLSGHSKRCTSPPPDSNKWDNEFQSPSDNVSELTLRCEECQSSSGYILNAQTTARQLSVGDTHLQIQLESESDDTSSVILPVLDDIQKQVNAVCLDKQCHHASSSYCSTSSSSGYVEQSRSLHIEESSSRDNDHDDVFELDVELTSTDDYQSSHDQLPNSTTPNQTNSTQTEGYIADLQSTLDLQLIENHQEACLNNTISVNNCVNKCTQSSHVVVDSQKSQPNAHHPTNTDGYILNDIEHTSPVTLAIMQGSEDQKMNITLEEEEPTIDQSQQANDIVSFSSHSDDLNVLGLNELSDPMDKRSNRGYVTTEDVVMTDSFTSREIVVPSSRVSPSKMEPGFTVCLDFTDGRTDHELDPQEGSPGPGIESKSSTRPVTSKHDSHHPLCLNAVNQSIKSRGYVTELGQPSFSTGTNKTQEQYIAYDFHSTSSVLRDTNSYSDLDSGISWVTPETSVSVSNSVCHQSPTMSPIAIQSQSNYYPPSDVSSGYESESTVLADTGVYIAVDKLEHLEV